MTGDQVSTKWNANFCESGHWPADPCWSHETCRRGDASIHDCDNVCYRRLHSWLVAFCFDGSGEINGPFVLWYYELDGNHVYKSGQCIFIHTTSATTHLIFKQIILLMHCYASSTCNLIAARKYRTNSVSITFSHNGNVPVSLHERITTVS